MNTRYRQWLWWLYVLFYDKLLLLPWYREYLESVADYMDPNAERSAELGCGTGNIWLRFFEKYEVSNGFHALLIDQATGMLRQARAKLSRWKQQITLMEGEMTAQLEEIDDESLDQVVIANAFYALTSEAQRKLLSTVKRKLNSGGRLVLTDPCDEVCFAALFSKPERFEEGVLSVPNRFWPLFRLFCDTALWRVRQGDWRLIRNILPFAYIIAINVRLGAKSELLKEDQLRSLVTEAGFQIIRSCRIYRARNLLLQATKN